MEVQFYFGHERMPLKLGHSLAQQPLFGQFCFFGVIPRSLLDFQQSGLETGVHWANIAPVLEDLLNKRIEVPNRDDDRFFSALQRVLAHGNRCGLLSLSDTCEVAAEYAQRFLNEMGVRASRLDLWCVKEGHTASIWQVVAKSNQAVLWQGCLNVARDQIASAELHSSAKQLMTAGDSDPSVVSINQIAYASDPFSGICIVNCDWIPHEGELRLPNQKKEANCEFFCVHQFVDEYDHLGRLKSQLIGRHLSEDDSTKVWQELVRLRWQHAKIDWQNETVIPFDIEVNDGDLIWSEQGVKVIAASALGQPMPILLWVDQLFNPSIRMHSYDPNQRYYWGNKAAAKQFLQTNIPTKDFLRLRDYQDRLLKHNEPTNQYQAAE